MARTVTVGYQPNLNKYFTLTQWAALEAGRRQAQKEFQKYADIVWAGSTYPNIWIGATNRSDVWAITYSNGKIYISVNKKFEYAWEDINMWTSLFMHEMSHILISMQHCSNLVGDGDKQCVLTIYGPRALIPCTKHLSVLQARYGKPIIIPPDPPEPPVPTTVTVNLTNANNAITVYLKQRKYTLDYTNHVLPDSIEDLIINASSSSQIVYLRECDVFDGSDVSTAEVDGLKVTASDFATVQAYGNSNSVATLYDTEGDDDFKVVAEYSNLQSPNRYIRCKGFTTTECKFSKAGHNVIRIGSSDVVVTNQCSVIGTIEHGRVKWIISN